MIPLNTSIYFINIDKVLFYIIGFISESMLIKKIKVKTTMITHSCNSSTWESDAGELPQVWTWVIDWVPSQQSETDSQRKEETKKGGRRGWVLVMTNLSDNWEIVSGREEDGSYHS